MKIGDDEALKGACMEGGGVGQDVESSAGGSGGNATNGGEVGEPGRGWGPRHSGDFRRGVLAVGEDGGGIDADGEARAIGKPGGIHGPGQIGDGGAGPIGGMAEGIENARVESFRESGGDNGGVRRGGEP